MTRAGSVTKDIQSADQEDIAASCEAMALDASVAFEIQQGAASYRDMQARKQAEAKAAAEAARQAQCGCAIM